MSDRDRMIDGDRNIDRDLNSDQGRVVEEIVIETHTVRDQGTVLHQDATVDQGHLVDRAPSDPLAQVANEGAVPSMSTDNTLEGTVVSDSDEAGPIAMVYEGQTVIDAAGDEIGKVRAVRMGDPGAVTTAGQESTDVDTPFENIFGAIFGGDSEVPETFRNELVRTGFIDIDGKGWFGADYAASAAQIAGVSGDTVRLNVAKDGLIQV